MPKPDKNPDKPLLKLEDIEKKNIFSVPDEYFDVLPAQIQARVAPSRHTAPLRWTWARPAVAFAAVTLLLLGTWFYRNDQTGVSHKGIAHLSDQDIINYLSDSEISQHDIIETVSRTGLNTDHTLLQHLSVPEDEILKHVEHVDSHEIEELI